VPQIFNPPLVATECAVVSAPIYGRIVDRFGSKRVIIFSYRRGPDYRFHLLPEWSIYLFLLRHALYALLATGTTHVAFVPLISKWFDRKRGTALSIALAGLGLGGVLLVAPHAAPLPERRPVEQFRKLEDAERR